MNICQNNQGFYIILLVTAFGWGVSGDDEAKQQRDNASLFADGLKKGRFSTSSSEGELLQEKRGPKQSPHQFLDGHQLLNQLPAEDEARNNINRGRKVDNEGSKKASVAQLALEGDMGFIRPLQSSFHLSGIDPQPRVNPPLLLHFPHSFLVSASPGPRIMQANPFTHPLGLLSIYPPTNLPPVSLENDFYHHRAPIFMIPLTRPFPLRMMVGQYVDRERYFHDAMDLSLQREPHELPRPSDEFRIRKLGPVRPFRRETEPIKEVQSKAPLERPFDSVTPSKGRSPFAHERIYSSEQVDDTRARHTRKSKSKAHSLRKDQTSLSRESSE